MSGRGTWFFNRDMFNDPSGVSTEHILTIMEMFDGTNADEVRPTELAEPTEP